MFFRPASLTDCRLRVLGRNKFGMIARQPEDPGETAYRPQRVSFALGKLDFSGAPFEPGRLEVDCRLQDRAAAAPDAQAHWKLKPPRWPVTSRLLQ